MKKLFLFLIFLDAFSAYSQQWQWGISDTSGFSQQPMIIKGDDHGYVYALSYSYQMAGTPTSIDIISETLQKYDSLGNLVWARNLPYPDLVFGFQSFQKMCVDPNGNIYLAGNFQDTLKTDNSVFTSNGSTDFFVAKLNTNGIEQWIRTFGGSPEESVADIACDGQGHVYITGTFETDAICDSLTFDAEVLRNTNPQYGGMFVASLDAAGQVQWASMGQISNPQTAYDRAGYMLSLDPQENLFVQGETSNTLPFVAGFDLSGNMVFHSSSYIQPSDDKFVADFVACGNKEFVFVLRTYNPLGSMLVKYDSLSQVQWSQQINHCTGTQSELIELGLSLDLLNNIYLTGMYVVLDQASPAQVNYSWTGSTLPYSGGFDAAVVKYNSLGHKQWVTAMSASGEERTTDLFISKTGDCYVMGHHSASYGNSQLIFNQDTVLNELSRPKVFVAKLSHNAIATGIPKNSSKQLSVYPVPTSGAFTIKGFQGPAGLSVKDLYGRTVKNQVISSDNDVIDLQGHASGIYFLELTENGRAHSYKIILE